MSLVKISWNSRDNLVKDSKSNTKLQTMIDKGKNKLDTRKRKLKASKKIIVRYKK